jgi:hypothetical protein
LGFDLFCFGGEGGEALKAKSSQVPDMFPEEFPVAPHYIPYALAKVVLLSPI